MLELDVDGGTVFPSLDGTLYDLIATEGSRPRDIGRDHEEDEGVEERFGNGAGQVV